MADSEGNFGGNGSVNWWIEAENPEDTPKSEKKPGHPRRWRQEGKDEAPPNGPNVKFLIRIEVPEPGPSRDAFVAELNNAASAATTATHVELRLPIRQFHEQQVRISWPSGQTSPNP